MMSCVIGALDVFWMKRDLVVVLSDTEWLHAQLLPVLHTAVEQFMHGNLLTKGSRSQPTIWLLCVGCPAL